MVASGSFGTLPTTPLFIHPTDVGETSVTFPISTEVRRAVLTTKDISQFTLSTARGDLLSSGCEPHNSTGIYTMRVALRLFYSAVFYIGPRTNTAVCRLLQARQLLHLPPTRDCVRRGSHESMWHSQPGFTSSQVSRGDFTLFPLPQVRRSPLFC